MIDINYSFWIVGLSFAIASFASYVALDLAKRVRTTDVLLSRIWWTAGSTAMGTGIWSMHFVGMQAANFPFAVGFGYALTALSWVAAVAVSAVALSIASRNRLSTRRWIQGSLTMGAGICTMHYIGMAAMDMAPSIHWSTGWVTASAVIAVIASAAALQIFFGLRRLQGRDARHGQIAAALVMGAAICGMHYAGMAAAGFPLDSVCRSVDQLRGDSLGLLVAGATIVLLVITSLTSAIDARLQDKATVLAASLQEANTELQRLAFKDPLTNLPNRLLLEERLGTAVERCARDGSSLAILFIDLDGFKPVNDSFGHACGDAVLRDMAHRLLSQMRATDTVARVGGDEFVLLVEDNPDAAAVVMIAQRLIELLARQVVWQGNEVRLSGSVGIAMYPADSTRESLMINADAAMYAVKRAGGGDFAFFAPHMNAGARGQIELRNDLRLAIEQGGLQLHYQPKVCARDGTVKGVEALARWRHATRGVVGPDVFIPIAERFGLIGALGQWVIEEACGQIARWREDGLEVRVAINLSVHQLRQADLATRLLTTLRRHGLEPSQLLLEVTESVAMEDAESHLVLFEQFDQAGIELSIDDFGTGYSSLSHLRRLPVSQVKIDRSFVRDLETSKDARVIVRAIINLAHALHLAVVAEGVETAAQRDVLAEMACDELQGYFFAKPTPADALTSWMAERVLSGVDVPVTGRWETTV